MEQHARQGDSIRAEIHGNVSGQLGIGRNIRQTQVSGAPRPVVSEADLATLSERLAELRKIVSEEAPQEKQGAAMERVAELSEAVAADEPDLATMEYVRNWFVKNLPSLAGAVTGVILNPIVGKLVEAAGDVVAAEFRRRFGTMPQ